jgi:pilus assembly protein Flp/PilA
MTSQIRRYWADEAGATAIEYGLIAALISVAIVTGMGALGAGLDAKFLFISQSLP